MKNKKVVFPKVMVRFLSVCIDFILYGALFFILSTFVFSHIFETKDENQLIAEAQVNSGILQKDDNGIYHQVNSQDYLVYEEIVENYYLSDKYFGSSFYKEHGGTRKAYTIEEYNEKILELGTNYTYFEYQYDENGNIDKTKLGIIKEDYYIDDDRNNGLEDYAKDDILVFYSRHYRELFSDLYNDEFYANARSKVVQSGVYQIFLSAMIPYILVYVIPPLTNKYGYTLGRFLTKIGIVSRHGLYQKKYFFLVRNIPMLILLVIMLFEDDLFVLAPIFGVYLLINWLVTIMNRENASVLDYISMSRNVNTKESIVYKTMEELERDNANGED